jgi:hypothetical protein
MSLEPIEVVRRVLETEYGITGLSDIEVREVLKAKVALMDPLELAAFKIRLGEQADGRSALASGYRVAGYVVVGLAAWLLWRPMAALVVTLGFGNMRKFAIRRAQSWAPTTALLIGTAYGTLLAVVVRVIQLAIVSSFAGSAFFAVVGFLAAGYLGYSANASSFSVGDQRRSAAGSAAVVAYLVTLVTWLGVLTLLRG